MPRIYGTITAILGVIVALYNAVWIPTVESPFLPPQWLIVFQLAWALISFHVVVRHRIYGPAPVLAATYVIYTGASVFYAWYLGTKYGTVTDAMTPTWWKLLSVVVGVWFVWGGVRMAKLKIEN